MVYANAGVPRTRTYALFAGRKVYGTLIVVYGGL